EGPLRLLLPRTAGDAWCARRKPATARELLSNLYRLLTLGPRAIRWPARQTPPSQGGISTMRGAPLTLARLYSLSAAATLFLAACGGGGAQPTAAPAAA